MYEEERSVILMADDDSEDCELTIEALRENNFTGDVRFVHDGLELLDYLKHRNGYSEESSAPRPVLIFLDLNMPRLSGYDALDAIRSDPEISEIPVVILTTSTTEEDVRRAYSAGAQSFITKPNTFGRFVDQMDILRRYWSEVSVTPSGKSLT